MARSAAVKPRILFDTGVISRIARRKPAFLKAAEEISETRKVYVTFATKLELYQWLRDNKKEMGARLTHVVSQYIEELPLWPHTQDITRQALALGQRVPHIGVADYIKESIKKCGAVVVNSLSS